VFNGAHHHISTRGNSNYPIYFQIDNFSWFCDFICRVWTLQLGCLRGLFNE